jgi:transposase
MTRGTGYTAERATAIAAALAAGNTRKVAAATGGISEDTFARWLKRYADFAEAIKSAEAEAQASHVANITQAGASGQWQASAWWLERRCPADWGKIDRVEVEVRRVAERVAAETGADPDWLIRRAGEIAAAVASAEPS